MPSSNNISTSYADLALFSPLAILTIYVAYAHGRPGLLGWFFLFLFCSLRLIGAGLAISSRHDTQPDKSVSVIQGIGLSPLILACAGVAAELWHYVNLEKEEEQSRRGGKEGHASFSKRILTSPIRLLHITIHILVLTGVALSAASASNLSTSSFTTTKNKRSNTNLYKSGSLILLLSYLLLVLAVTHTLSTLWVRAPAASLTTKFRTLIFGRHTVVSRLAFPLLMATGLLGERTGSAVFVAFSKQGFARLQMAGSGEKWLLTWADVAWAAVFLAGAGLWTRRVRKVGGMGRRQGGGVEEGVGLKGLSGGVGGTRGEGEGHVA